MIISAQFQVLTYLFQGTKLTWVGWTPSGYPTGNSEASYTIDSQPAVTFRVPGLPSGSSAQYNQHLFETPTLPLGEHTLTVTHNGPSAPLTLDHLLVQNGDIILPGGQDTNSGNDGPDASNADAGTTPIPSPTNSGTQVNQATSGVSIGAIAGGAAGGAAILILCIIGLIWYLRRRKRDRITRVNLNTTGGNAGLPPPVAQITPFQYSSNSPGFGRHPAEHSSRTNLISKSADPANWSTPRAYQDNPSSPLHPQQVHRDQKVRPNRSQSNQMPSPYSYHPAGTMSDTSSSSGPLPSHRGSNIVHHEDSGIRITSPDQLPEVIDVPPSYTPA